MKDVYIAVTGPASLVDPTDSTSPSTPSIISANIGYNAIPTHDEPGLTGPTLNVRVSRTAPGSHWKSAIIDALLEIATEQEWNIVRIIFPDFDAVSP